MRSVGSIRDPLGLGAFMAVFSCFPDRMLAHRNARMQFGGAIFGKIRVGSHSTGPVPGLRRPSQ
jgi:hypothetical protein